MASRLDHARAGDLTKIVDRQRHRIERAEHVQDAELAILMDKAVLDGAGHVGADGGIALRHAVKRSWFVAGTIAQVSKENSPQDLDAFGEGVRWQ